MISKAYKAVRISDGTFTVLFAESFKMACDKMKEHFGPRWGATHRLEEATESHPHGSLKHYGDGMFSG